MKTEKSILMAFVLNLGFSIFELVGGIFTGSVAVISDSFHDIGDALSIGIAFFLEKKSKKQPDKKYSYGYARYSVLGSLITTLILLFGSAVVIFGAVRRIIDPKEINYNGMIVFAVVGVIVNLGAALLTREGESLNQKAVNLHILEDVLGWVIVLVGAVVMRFTDLYIIDPLMSIGVALFVIVSAVKNMREVFEVFLEKTPHSIDLDEIKDGICKIDGVLDVHHIHVWSMDGQNNYATMHIVAEEITHEIKDRVREKLKEQGIVHSTLELEAQNENCQMTSCQVDLSPASHHHHHHH